MPKPASASNESMLYLGREFVDNDLFKYSIAAEFFIRSAVFGHINDFPQGIIVFNPLQVDCVVA